MNFRYEKSAYQSKLNSSLFGLGGWCWENMRTAISEHNFPCLGTSLLRSMISYSGSDTLGYIL